MKSLVSALLVFVGALLVSAPSVTSAESRQPAKKSDYPLTTCVVSDEKLDDKPFEYVHKEAGKPDRVLLLCCEGCVDDFKKEPAKYLKKLDDAVAAKAKAKAGKQKS